MFTLLLSSLIIPQALSEDVDRFHQKTYKLKTVCGGKEYYLKMGDYNEVTTDPLPDKCEEFRLTRDFRVSEEYNLQSVCGDNRYLAISHNRDEDVHGVSTPGHCARFIIKKASGSRNQYNLNGDCAKGKGYRFLSVDSKGFVHSNYLNEEGSCQEWSLVLVPTGHLGEWDFDDGGHDGIIGDVRLDSTSNVSDDGLELKSGEVVASDFVDAELGSKRTIAAYVTMNDPSRIDGSLIGIEGYSKAGEWTSIFSCLGDGQTDGPDRILTDDWQNLAKRSVGVRICTRGKYDDCVYSRGVNSALKNLQSGLFNLQPQGINRCVGDCISKEWEGPGHRLVQLRWYCNPRESNHVFHACGNQKGLHIVSRAKSHCEWDFGESDALEIQLLQGEDVSGLPSSSLEITRGVEVYRRDNLEQINFAHTHFLLHESEDNACPRGYSRVLSRDACLTAAKQFEFVLDNGLITEESEPREHDPHGCFTWTYRIYFNSATEDPYHENRPVVCVYDPLEIDAGKKTLMTMVMDGGNVDLYRDSQLLSTFNTPAFFFDAGSWRVAFGGRDSNIDATIHKAAVWDRAFAPSEVVTLCASLDDCDVKVPDTSCHVTGYRPENEAFETVEPVVTSSDCQHHCSLSSRCKFFGFVPQTEVCSLYHAHGRLNKATGSIFGPKECPKFKAAYTKYIICPFLGTLVNEGALPVRDSYTKFELESVTVQSGIPQGNVDAHVHGGNFFHNPSGVQNIFDMEGAVNEHITSTGIHDCPTDYSKCPESTKYDPHGTEKCPGAVTEDCKIPNVDIFERFFDHTDANEDGFIDLDEMEDDANNFPVVDENRVTGRGSITGGFQDYISLMGVDDDGNHQVAQRNTKMDRETMRRVMITRRFPETYMFPYISGGANFVQLGDWRFGPVANGNYFGFSHRKSDRVVVYDAAGMNFNGGGNNFRLWDEDLMSGEYPANVQLDGVFTFSGAWKIGNIDDSYLSISMESDTGCVFGATGNVVDEHPEKKSLWEQEEKVKGVFFGDRFIQFGNFRFADAGAASWEGDGLFQISHSAFKDRGITFLEDGEVVEGEFDYDSDVWDRPVEGTCQADGCVHM